METATMNRLAIDCIRADERCQPRAELSEYLVIEYAAAMSEGASFPPLVVFQDEDANWLADGFHRLEAARQAGLERIDCDIRPGSFRDAVLHTVGANATHGLRRSNADKHRAVRALLLDPEWSRWSDREIARRCGVSDRFVNSIRAFLTANIRSEDQDATRTYTDKHGNQSTMNVSNIGRDRSALSLNDRVEIIHRQIRRMEEGERMKGEALARAKSLLTPDQFRAWLDAEFGWSPLEANRLIARRVA